MDQKVAKVLVLSSSKERGIHLFSHLKNHGLKEPRLEGNGMAGMKILSQEKFDLIVIDYDLKFINGLLCAKEIKSSDKIPNHPVMLFGEAKLKEEEEKSLEEYGIVKYLSYPVKPGDFNMALSSTLSLFKTSGTVESKYTKAKEALLKNEGEEAVSAYSELRNLTNKSTRSSLGLAQSYQANNESEKADEVMMEISLEGKGTPSSQLFSIRLFLKKGDDVKALEIIDTYLAGEPGAYHYSALSKLLFEFKVFDKLVAVCSQAIEKGFGLSEIYLHLAKAHHLQKDYELSLKVLEGFEKSFGASGDSLNLKGANLRRLGNFNEAVLSYEAAIKLSPKDSKVYFNMAMCHVEMKDEQRAVSFLESALEIAPGFDKAKDKLDEIKRKVAS